MPIKQCWGRAEKAPVRVRWMDINKGDQGNPDYRSRLVARQLKAYDIESFVGNTGGYIGLFLGYALLALPGYLVAAFGMIKTAIKVWLQKGSKRKDSSDSTDKCTSVMVILKNLISEDLSSPSLILTHNVQVEPSPLLV